MDGVKGDLAKCLRIKEKEQMQTVRSEGPEPQITRDMLPWSEAPNPGVTEDVSPKLDLLASASSLSTHKSQGGCPVHLQNSAPSGAKVFTFSHKY